MNDFKFRINYIKKIENKKLFKPISLNLSFIHSKNYYISNFSHFQVHLKKSYKHSYDINKKKSGFLQLKSNIESRREFFQNLFIMPLTVIFVFDEEEKKLSPNYTKNIDQLYKRLSSSENKKKMKDYRQVNENYKSQYINFKEEDFIHFVPERKKPKVFSFVF